MVGLTIELGIGQRPGDSLGGLLQGFRGLWNRHYILQSSNKNDNASRRRMLMGTHQCNGYPVSLGRNPSILSTFKPFGICEASTKAMEPGLAPTSSVAVSFE